MRLSELFEETDPEKERQFQMAWVTNQPSLAARDIPPAYFGNVKTRAHELMNLDMDVDDAINTAASEVSKKLRQRAQTKAKRQPTQQAKVQEPKTTKTPDRVSKKSGKKWGNQYYSDPASSGGIAGALDKNNPKAIAKKAIDKIDQKIGSDMDITKALSGNKNRRK